MLKKNQNMTSGLHLNSLKEYYWSIEVERIWENALNEDGSKNDGMPLKWPEEEGDGDGDGDGDAEMKIPGNRRKSPSSCNNARKERGKIEVEMTYEYRGKVNIIVVVTTTNNGDEDDNDEGTFTSALPVEIFLTFVESLSSATSTSTSLKELQSICKSMLKCKPHRVQILSQHQQNMERILNRILLSPKKENSTLIQRIYSHFQKHPVQHLLLPKSMLKPQRSSTMFSSFTLCCAVTSKAIVSTTTANRTTNYWRAGHMCLDKNVANNVISIMVFCTKTLVPILIIPISSISKCYDATIVGGIGSELQLCTTSRSHGSQLFTFVFGTEQLCEEWNEIIKTKACL
jgi:hypothetical protein